MLLTSENTNRKGDFIGELNASYKKTCLQCSFSDKELGEYIQFKKHKEVTLPVKYAVSHVRMQSDGVWVLGSRIYISDEGKQTSADQSKHVWIGDIYHGAGVSSELDQCTIELPLSTEPLTILLAALRESMKHNFLPSVITMAGTIMALHFQKFIENLKSCPILLAYGTSGSGKTTTLLLSALSLLGAENIRFFRNLSPAKIVQYYALLPTSHLALTILTPRVDSVKLSWICLMGQNKEKSQEVKSSQYLQLLYLQTLPLLTNKGEYRFHTHAMKSPAKMLNSQHVGP